MRGVNVEPQQLKGCTHMYEVIGREATWGRRFSRFIVRFSTQWPHGARRVYLVSTLTSLYPGRFKMSRRVATLKYPP